MTRDSPVGYFLGSALKSRDSFHRHEDFSPGARTDALFDDVTVGNSTETLHENPFVLTLTEYPSLFRD